MASHLHRMGWVEMARIIEVQDGQVAVVIVPEALTEPVNDNAPPVANPEGDAQ